MKIKGDCRKFRNICFLKSWSWKDLFGISVDHDVSKKTAVCVLRVICYPEWENSPCPVETSQVSHRAGLDMAQKDPSQFLLLLIVPIFLQWGRNTNSLDKQISNLGIRNLGSANLNFIFPIFVHVKSAAEAAHPCVAIYFYSKSNKIQQLLKFILFLG
jgi:hypothetical protein